MMPAIFLAGIVTKHFVKSVRYQSSMYCWSFALDAQFSDSQFLSFHFDSALKVLLLVEMCPGNRSCARHTEITVHKVLRFRSRPWRSLELSS